MKTRFTTLDICAILAEINSKLIGMRLANVYDINNKTYLLKLAKPDSKIMLLMESGIRLHISEFDWPKNMMPSGFSMKLRKHLKGRRLVSAKQLGIDRIVDMQFGSEDAAFHVILELYDRGNIILTDYQYTILNILRYRKDKAQMPSPTDTMVEENSDVRFAVQETYPLHVAKQRQNFEDIKQKLEEILKTAKNDDVLKRILIPHLPYGAPCIEHCLLSADLPAGIKIGKGFLADENMSQLFGGLQKGEELLSNLTLQSSSGYIVQKREKRADGTFVLTNAEFHPYLFKQHEDCPSLSFDSFNKAVDEFFGNLESQKADMKILQQEKSAHKKLDNIRKDHEHRLTHLEKEQETDMHKAQLIEENLPLVEQAIRVVRTALANQIDWEEIGNLIKDAQASGDPVALSISKLNLKSNEFTMALHKPYEEFSSDDSSLSDEDDDKRKSAKPKKLKPVKVDIDIGLSAYGNTKKYYNKKRQASHKHQKIIDASQKAIKSAEKKTTQTLKEAATIHNIQKARKTFWFEKFIWFISSENYLVIGGRDAQQNEILVKKYLTGGDLYVHADLHGATSCIIKNPSNADVPPKTLNEAGTMAICHSAAWNAKVVTSAWWVCSRQVTKTAPSGEYLTTGSFLIRGKKNYLPPSYLIYGFGVLFKVDETCIHKHKDERKVITQDTMQHLEEDISVELENELEIASDGDGSDRDVEETSATKDLAIEVGQEDGGDATDEMSSEKVDETLSVNNTVDNEDSPEQSDEQMDMEGTVAFPETNVKVQFKSLTDNAVLSDEGAESSSYIVYLGDNEPVVVQNRAVLNEKPQNAKQKHGAKKASDGDNTSKTPMKEERKGSEDNGGQVGNEQPRKRGQRNKMKKLKTKYKDQDDEERAIKMDLLQQSQSQKARDRKAKKNKTVGQPSAQKEGGRKEKRPPQKKPLVKTEHDDDSDEERAKVLQNEHLSLESADILNSLTGCPLPDDVLLFALPVCAPYNTMHNYKFKVKLTPGNTKKGKGAKTALNLFQNMRETTNQEKDHLRSIKDHDLATNIPGKVKVSSTNLQLQRKKK